MRKPRGRVCASAGPNADHAPALHRSRSRSDQRNTRERPRRGSRPGGSTQGDRGRRRRRPPPAAERPARLRQDYARALPARHPAAARALRGVRGGAGQEPARGPCAGSPSRLDASLSRPPSRRLHGRAHRRGLGVRDARRDQPSPPWRLVPRRACRVSGPSLAGAAATARDRARNDHEVGRLRHLPRALHPGGGHEPMSMRMAGRSRPRLPLHAGRGRRLSASPVRPAARPHRPSGWSAPRSAG